MSKYRILIIEDDQDYVEPLLGLLRPELGNEYHIEAHYTGSEGVFYAKTFPYDLFIVDLFLPDMMGGEVVNHLKKLSKSPIIIMSNYYDLAEPRIEDADDFFFKGIDHTELASRIKLIVSQD